MLASLSSDPVGSVLEKFLRERRLEAVAIDPRLGPLVDELLSALFSGGKRLRPELAMWGHRAAGGSVGEPILQAAAALEMLHTFALIQDDVMDRSATRRGRPASHVTLAAAAEIGDRDRFGASAAILLGDLALIWADRLLSESDFPPDRVRRGYRVYDELRAEVTLGQYLDVLASHAETPTEEDALRVNRYKTASYTVQRPIQLGMALAGGSDEMVASVAPYAVPAGIAFQLRDDLLGAFGDPGQTGKPSGEDLLDRKPTWLWARTLRLRPDAAALADVAALRQVIRDSGAAADAEQKIRSLTAEAVAAARRIPVASQFTDQLVELTERLVWRSS
jgi:geranylgeranyl diphosphate synthase type I